MKPYGGALSDEQRIFNYRLSRARRTIENAFGILVMRWGWLRSEFLCYPDKLKLIGACCSLHNYLLKRNPTYLNGVDSYDDQGNLTEGEWRSVVHMDQINLMLDLQFAKDSNIFLIILTFCLSNTNVHSALETRKFIKNKMKFVHITFL